jgi:hypothetical protein
MDGAATQCLWTWNVRTTGSGQAPDSADPNPCISKPASAAAPSSSCRSADSNIFRLFALEIDQIVHELAGEGGTTDDLELAVMRQAMKWGLSATLRDDPGGAIEIDVA